MAPLKKERDKDGADVTGAAGDENVHRVATTTKSSEIAVVFVDPKHRPKS